MLGCACGAVLAKALPALWLWDLLVHSTQELEVSPRALAKFGLRVREKEEVSHFAGCASIGTTSSIFIRTHVTKEEAGRGEWKEIQVKDQPLELLSRVV